MALKPNIQMSSASVPLVHEVEVLDEAGRTKLTHIPGERSLTIYLDKREVVTLMTLRSTVDIDALTSKRVVTTGCGQGTMFGGLMEEISEIALPDGPRLSQEAIVALVDAIRVHDSIYKRSGSVHACAVFERVGDDGVKLLHFIEDVGRHNAVDSISGLMWLANKPGKDLIFFTTGRLTSEMVIKGAQMGVPFLLTRSGVTLMGLELARKTNLTILSRCSGKHFEIYNAPERVIFTKNS